MRIFLILWGLCIPWTLLSQIDPSTCLAEVKRLYASVDELAQRQVDGKMFYMHYSLSSLPADSTLQASEDEFRVWRGNKKQYLRGSQFTLLQDERYSFMILPNKGHIFWSDSPNKSQTSHEPDWGMWHNELLKSAELLSYRELPGGEWEVALVLPNKFMASHYIDAWYIRFSPGAEVPSQVRMTYLEGYELRETTIVIHSCSWTDDLPQAVQGSAYRQVFAKKGQLRSEYQQFKLIDDHIQ